MKKILIAILLTVAPIAQAEMRTIWMNGEPVMINQIGNSTFINGPGGTTTCITTGSFTSCN